MSIDNEGWRAPNINIRNIINDFLEMYSADPEEVMVIESIANSLDAKPKNIIVNLKRTGTGDIYSIADDGRGMTENDFEDSYHGLALSTKEKGTAIGFAGVGGKLYLVMLEAGHSIYTETKSSSFHGASEFTMKGDQAVWRRIAPKGKVQSRTGTFVEVTLRPDHSIDQPTVESVVRDNFNTVLLGLYGNVQIHLNWKTESQLEPWKPELESESEESLKVDGSDCTASFWLTKGKFDESRGLDLIILGKKIKSHQWFNLEFEIKPEFARRITGFVTADPLAKLLTTNKQDLKVGNERTWLSFKKQANEAFLTWLKEIGALRESQKPRSEELAAAHEVSEVINRMLKLPEFNAYNPYLRRTITNTAIKSDKGELLVAEVEGQQGVSGTIGSGSTGGGIATVGGEEGKGFISSDTGTEIGERVRRKLRTGINVNVTERPDNKAESWLAPEAIVINKAHPVYKKSEAQGNTQEIAHMLRCIFIELIQNVDPSKKEAFDELAL